MSFERFFAGVTGPLQRLSPRDRRAIGIGLLILLPALLWVAVIRPYASLLTGMSDRMAAERGLLEREQAVLNQAAAFPLRIEAAATALAAWDERLVRSPNLALAEAEVSATLEAAAHESDVLLEDVRALAIPRGATPPEGLTPLRMSVQGESDFQGVLEFLNQLEENPLFFRIVGLSLDQSSVGSDDDGTGQGEPVAVTFTLIVEAFAPASLDALDV